VVLVARPATQTGCVTLVLISETDGCCLKLQANVVGRRPVQVGKTQIEDSTTWQSSGNVPLRCMTENRKLKKSDSA